MVRSIIFSLAAFLRHDHRQAVFPAQPVADVAYAVISALIGNVLLSLIHIFDALLDGMSDKGIRIVTATAREITEVEKE